MQYVLGVDGGQTKTLAMVATLDGTVVGCGISGPSNHLNEPGAYERLEKAVKNSIFMATSNLEPGDFRASFFGMASIDPKVRQIIKKIWHSESTEVDSDTISAWAGATMCNPGIVTISGTGSVSFGINERMERSWSAYWAYLFGDEGSGYDLGRKALRIAARASDGRGEKSVVLDKILDHFGVHSMDEVRGIIYGRVFERHEIASLACLVIEAAKLNDIVAMCALEEAGVQLAEGAIAVIKRLKMVDQQPLVHPVGGVFEHAGKMLIEPFSKAINESVPTAKVRQPLFSPIVGSVFMALSKVNGDKVRGIYENTANSFQEYLSRCIGKNC